MATKDDIPPFFKNIWLLVIALIAGPDALESIGFSLDQLNGGLSGVIQGVGLGVGAKKLSE